MTQVLNSFDNDRKQDFLDQHNFSFDLKLSEDN
jgi:hypothetical protein